jgi:fibronectin-binding autotransporter adhesin
MDGVGSAPVTITKTGTGVADEIAALVYFNDDLTITSTNAVGRITFSGGLRSGQSNITFAGAGTTNIVTGALITGGNVVKDGAGNLILGIANSWGGSTQINAGKITANAANVLPNRSALTIAAGAMFDLNNQDQNIGSLAGLGTVNNSGGSAKTLTVGRDETSTVFGGKLTSTSDIARLALTKAGAGTFTLNSGDASLFTGAIILNGGSLVLDYANVAAPATITTSAASTSSTSVTLASTAGLAVGRLVTGTGVAANTYITAINGNIITLSAAATVTSGQTLTASQPQLIGTPSAGSGLTIAGGSFRIIGKAGLISTQVLGNLAIGNTGGVFSVVPGDTNLTKVTLGSFAATTAGGSLLLSAPANTLVTTTSAKPAENIYGAGRAVFTDGTNYDWLSTISTGTPYAFGGMGTAAGAAYTGALPNVGVTLATGNYTVLGSQAQTAASQVLTLKATSNAAGQILALGAFDLGFGVSGGGLLVTGTDAYTISSTTGGLKVGTNSSGEIVIHQFNTGGLTISAAIKDHTASTGITSLVKAGTGLLTLTGTSTFTGNVTINAGILAFSSTGVSGTGTLGYGVAKPVVIRDGATLRYTGGTATLAAGTTANSHTFSVPGGSGIIDISTAATNLTIAGVISGSGGLTKTGLGGLTLSGANSFTGSLIIAQGKVFSAAGVIGDNTPVVINAGATWEVSDSDTFGSLAGAGTLAINSGSQRNPGLGQDNSNTTFSGALTSIGSRHDHNFSKKSGVWTVAMPVTSTWVGGSTFVDGGVIRVASGMGQQFNPTATLVVNHAAQSAIFDLNGSAQTVGALNFFNTPNSNINAQGLVLLGNGGTLTLGGNIGVNAQHGAGTQAAGIIGSAGASLSMGGGQRTITVIKSLNLAPGEAELVIDAVITGGGPGGGWLKTGGGTLRIQGQSQLQGTLPNRFDAGLTILDYATALTPTTTDRINPVGALDLRGGSVSFLGSPNLDVVQNVAGLLLPNVAAGNTGAYSSVDLFSSNGRNLVLNLGPITQRLAGTVRFTLPSGTQSSVNGITTTTPNDLFTGLVGTLGAAATVTTSSGASSFATRVGTNIVPVTMANRDVLSGVLNGENITDVSGYAGSLLNVVSPMTVRFNAANSSLLSIPDGGILKVISGGILQTAAAATANLALTGAATTQGSPTVTVTSTSGLLVGMPISGNNIPAGARIAQVVDATTLLIDTGATATATGGSLSAGAISVIQGGTLRAPNRELIFSNDTTGWNPNVVGDVNSLYPTKRLLVTSSIDGQQGIIKTGDGLLALRAGAQANDFSGLVQIQAGVIELGRTGRGSFAIGDFAPIAFSNQESANLRLLRDGLTLTGPIGATAVGSPVVKVDSIQGLAVGQVLNGNGINPAARIVSLEFNGSFTSVASVAITGAVTASGSPTITVPNAAGLVVGQPISGPNIPLNAFITGITGNSVILSVNATQNGTVDLTADAVTVVTTDVNHGIKSGDTLAISGADVGAAFNTTRVIAVDLGSEARRFVFTGGAFAPSASPRTLSIDAGKRFVMSEFSFVNATAVTTFQAASQYGETVGALSGGNRQTNFNYNFIDLGLGATLTVNQTTDTGFNGEFMGLGNLRLIGNGTLSLTNASRAYGDTIIDGGVLRVVTTNSTGGRIYATLPAGSFPNIFINRFGALMLDRVVNTTQDGVGDTITIRLNSAAGTRGNLVTGSRFADTLPLGLYVFNNYNEGGGRREDIGNLFFDSGTNYLSMLVSGNTRSSSSSPRASSVMSSPPETSAAAPSAAQRELRTIPPAGRSAAPTRRTISSPPCWAEQGANVGLTAGVDQRSAAPTWSRRFDYRRHRRHADHRRGHRSGDDRGRASSAPRRSR